MAIRPPCLLVEWKSWKSVFDNDRYIDDYDDDGVVFFSSVVLDSVVVQVPVLDHLQSMPLDDLHHRRLFRSGTGQSWYLIFRLYTEYILENFSMKVAWSVMTRLQHTLQLTTFTYARKEGKRAMINWYASPAFCVTTFNDTLKSVTFGLRKDNNH